MQLIDPDEAKRLVHAGGEVAFLDVREAGQFGEGHPLLAVPCPYSTLELRVGRLVPRRDVPLLVIDEGDGVSQKAGRRLAELGYRDIRVVAGGAPSWAAAGHTLYKGVNVPSKMLGELYEHAAHVPTVGPDTLAEWRAKDRPFRLFDARPVAEYAKMRVPGAICLPNGELAHRFDTVIDDPRIPVVVTCAGRTRSIVGAAGLALSAMPNPVYALENGTQGWALAGGTLERDNSADPFPALDASSRAASRDRGVDISRRWAISQLGPEDLPGLAADTSRTLYLFDVRSVDEFRAGHAKAALHAPAGQLVQATDQWIAVRHARVVLLDDTGLRAALTAFWLRQLGYEVHVLPDIDREDVRGRIDRLIDAPQPWSPAPLPHVSPARAQMLMNRREARIVDLRGSRAHNGVRIAGSLWSIRPRLSARLGQRGAVLLLAETDDVAELAALDLREAGIDEIAVIQGGLAAWRGAGLAVETGGTPVPDDQAIDYLFFVHDRHDGNLDASRRYLAWETALIDQLDEQERGEFALAV